MVTKKRKKLKVKNIVLICVLGIVVFAGAFVLSASPWFDADDTAADVLPTEERDPLPGELVQMHLDEDSVRHANKDIIKKNMAEIIKDYRKAFREEYYTGYFLTDFDEDGIPELWVRVGNYRENSKLELFYPEADGSLKKSLTIAEPGKYYLGPDYMMQVVGAGPGIISINRIKITNGQMDVENMRDIDLYADPGARVPKFSEKEAPDHSLGNLSPLYASFN